MGLPAPGSVCALPVHCAGGLDTAGVNLKPPSMLGEERLSEQMRNADEKDGSQILVSLWDWNLCSPFTP